MDDITNIAADWSDEITLTQDEDWQCKAGQVELLINAEPGPNRSGSILPAPFKEKLRAGETVRYRRVGRVPAIIVRMARG